MQTPFFLRERLWLTICDACLFGPLSAIARLRTHSLVAIVAVSSVTDARACGYLPSQGQLQVFQCPLKHPFCRSNVNAPVVFGAVSPTTFASLHRLFRCRSSSFYLAWLKFARDSDRTFSLNKMSRPCSNTARGRLFRGMPVSHAPCKSCSLSAVRSVYSGVSGAQQKLQQM